MTTTDDQGTRSPSTLSDDPNTTEEVPEQTTDTDQPDQAEVDEQNDSPDQSKTGKEAAKYRRQLRETETERDQLAESLTAARKQIVESMTGLAKPSALWAAGTEVNDLLDDDGLVDPGKVAEAVEHASATLGLVRTPRPDKSQGSSDLGRTTSEQFAAAFSMSDR
ncbi:hypothetical protein ABH903_003467 [Brevibacterium epidermidis]|jgi:hypothetical protein|uniref:Scaffolding protein n=1 Tax=Brevibacterium epidermidis TaxID=1698 RepID=A0ABV4EPF1_BREEP